MKERTFFATVAFPSAIVFAVIVSALWWLTRPANGQPPQPGDTPAPVVDVFESGILTASVVCPPTVQAGSVLVLDVSGTSEGDTALYLVPAVPSGAVQYDSGREYVYVWIARTGRYVGLWTVEGEGGAAGEQFALEVIAGDPGPPGGVPPEDTAFIRWVRAETAKVEGATNHANVAATFRTLADAVDAGEHQGSAAIQAASEEALFGPEGSQNAAWGPWWNIVFLRMRKDLKLSTQDAWAKHYRQVAAGVER